MKKVFVYMLVAIVAISYLTDGAMSLSSRRFLVTGAQRSTLAI